MNLYDEALLEAGFQVYTKSESIQPCCTDEIDTWTKLHMCQETWTK